MTTANLTRPTVTTPFCETSYPITVEQRGLWYVQQLAPECGAYHLVFSFEVTRTGKWPLNWTNLLRQLIVDYPILRTSLAATSPDPQQWVWNTANADIRYGDASKIHKEELRKRLRSETREPFNLELPPLWRIHIYKTDENQWVVALVVHHVLFDFWSLGLLLQEVAGRLGMVELPVAKIDGIGFGSYAVMQATKLSANSSDEPWKQYWLAQLQDAPLVHGLPLDYKRPVLQTYEGRSVAFSLTREVTDRIKLLAKVSGATPFMVMLAAYYVLLNRFSGDADIVVASPVAGRLERPQRAMLGQFVNTVALRCQIDTNEPFSHLLGAVKQNVIDALRHQQCPFSWLVEELAPQRDSSYAPIAQIAFSWERLPLLADFADFFLAEPAEIIRNGPGFELKPYPLPQQEGQFELQLEMGGERDEAFVGVLKYNDKLFQNAFANEMTKAFISLLDAIVIDPNSRIADLSLTDPFRLASWLERGIGPKLALPEMSVLEQIRKQAEQTPNAVAVSDDSLKLTYRELLQQSDQLACGLKSIGVTPENRVGLMLERNCDLVVAILGIWSVGAAYVPMDPALPSDRVNYIANDAQLAALISKSNLRSLWPTTLPVVCVDQAILSVDGSFVPTKGAIAYLLYTSGSTGKPKGVQIGQHSVKNFLHSMQALLQFGRDTRLLAVTTPSFDISVLELLLPLLVGGTVVVCNHETTMDGVKLARQLQTDHINVLQATPATWKLLIDAEWGGVPELIALCGGEPLPSTLAEELFQRVGALWNVYGPTETTVWSSAARLLPGEPIHLGQPIGNTQFYVLDEYYRPVPPGVLGELWIGGDGLAVDYWQRPDLTEKQFTSLPTLPFAGRLYRTGDRVRWKSDGRLEHHGRLDFQVKLRGYRIELGEIETVLLQQPGISDAIVIVREDRIGDKRLVAYLIGQSTPSAVLISSLREVLPAYMVPSAFMFLDAMPQTANRKINRKALPAPDDAYSSESFVAPRDAAEIKLGNLFAELLGLPKVGIHDDFFSIGGHSLLAVQLVTGIRRIFDVELPISTLVQHGTVAQLAACVRGETGFEPSMLLTLRSGKDVQPLWLFHPIGGNVFCYLELTRQLNAQRPVLAFQSPGLEMDGGAEVTVETMARCYLEELRKRQPSGPYLLGGWCFGGVIAFEVARQLRDSGEIVDGLALIDTRAPIAANVPSDADDATLLSWFARDLAAPFGKSLKIEPEELRALADDEKFEHVLAAAKMIEVIPENADSAQLSRYFEVYIANGIALQTYFPAVENIPVLLVRAIDETEDFGPSLGWNELTPDSLVQVELPGDHNSIMYSPQVNAVAAAIDSHYSSNPLSGFTA